MFDSLGGVDDEVRKWRKRSVFEYYSYLEQSKKLNDSLRRDEKPITKISKMQKPNVPKSTD